MATYFLMELTLSWRRPESMRVVSSIRTREHRSLFIGRIVKKKKKTKSGIFKWPFILRIKQLERVSFINLPIEFWLLFITQ